MNPVTVTVLLGEATGEIGARIANALQEVILGDRQWLDKLHDLQELLPEDPKAEHQFISVTTEIINLALAKANITDEELKSFAAVQLMRMVTQILFACLCLKPLER